MRSFPLAAAALILSGFFGSGYGQEPRRIYYGKKDQSFAEKSLVKWLKERDREVAKKTIAVYGGLFQAEPYVPDKGIESVLNDLAARRPIPKEFFGRPELFRDNGPLGKVLAK
jgi:hypothetical protein